MMLSTMSKVQVLRQMELFAEVPAEELVPIAYIAREVEFPAGTQFITQGEAGTSVYILVSGIAQVVLPGVGAVAERSAPTIIGEMAIFTRRPRSAHCVAATDCTALAIDHDDFRALLGAKPSLAYGIIRVLAFRLEEAIADLQAHGIATLPAT